MQELTDKFSDATDTFKLAFDIDFSRTSEGTRYATYRYKMILNRLYING